ncbi:MAG TPA: DUF4230 domain-containing protein [Coleofasciculaceae cyanobacterium]
MKVDQRPPSVQPPQAPASPARPRQPGLLRRLSNNFALMATGGLVAIVATSAAGIGNWGKGIGDFVAAPFTTPQPPAKADVRSLTIDTIRGASALTTTVFSMEAIVPAQRDRVLGQFVVGSTKLLYIAYGEISAGIDLSKLKPEDVRPGADGKLEIRLPPPEILNRKIDVARSRVYDYDRGFLGLGPDSAPELMARAQEEALDRVTESACQRGLLTEANKRAATVVRQLLGASGPNDRATILIQEPSPAACAIAKPTTAEPIAPPATAPTQPAQP